MQTNDIQALRAIISDPERVSTKKADLEAHSIDESFHEAHEPEAVVWPQNATEIDLDGMHFIDIVKREIISLKVQGTREITAHLSKPFETKRDIPQTGFVVFKFI